MQIKGKLPKRAKKQQKGRFHEERIVGDLQQDTLNKRTFWDKRVWLMLCFILACMLLFQTYINEYLKTELCQRVCGVCNGGSMTDLDLIGSSRSYGCQCWNETTCKVISNE